ncbi:hypothetical protein M3Y99_01680200 [Aphelenchoides fujianensis]|nr:hypothetical protein M3Y99_01680200 [Aphelenchoides fujianensis]
MKDPSDGGTHTYTGNIYEDNFVLGNISFTAAFGVITGSTSPQAKEDVHMGLGYRAKGDYGFDENTEPIRKILEQAAENGVLIQAGKDANHGQITFGKKNDTGCLSSVLVDAKMSAQNVLQWSFEFKKVQGNKVTVTDDSQRQARFDLSTPYIIMPTSLAKDIGQDSFTDYSQMPDIVFEFETEKIVLTPEQYSQKQGDKYKAMIQNRDDPPGFVLGTQFMHGRCILLDAENKKIGISQLPPTKAAGAHLPAVLLVALSFGLLSVFRF